MTRLIARLMLALMALPLAAAVFVLAMLAVVSTNPGGPPSARMAVLIWTPVYAYIVLHWTLVWRSEVRWTRWRVMGTVGVGLLALASGVALGMVVWLLGRSNAAPEGIGAFIGGGAPPLVWAVGTILVWRETNAERAQRLGGSGADSLVCPVCGYDMTSCRDTRCPECGSVSTLREFVAAQPRRDVQSVEQG